MLRKKMIENADKNAIKHILFIFILVTITIIISNITLPPGIMPFCILISIYTYSFIGKEIDTFVDDFVQNIYDFLNGNILRDITET